MICITGTGGTGGGTDAVLPGLPPSAAAAEEAEVAEAIAIAGDWADEGGAEAARRGGMETAVMG
ncbi:hypothetical protein [Cupriavidus basilensis]|uniref:hypothetical protein n=1 Tax=Cupriavidus basilensis TaxID=68895 RepID=UPI0039F73A8E